MYSGLAILYLLFLRKQFVSEWDGLLVVLARSILHLCAIIFFVAFESKTGEGSIALALVYYIIVGTNRGSAFILSRGFRILNDNSIYSKKSFQLSLFFSLVELIPATFYLFVLCLITLDGILPTLVSQCLLLLWLYFLTVSSRRLGDRRRVFKQYIALIGNISIPTQLLLTAGSYVTVPIVNFPVGAILALVIIFILLLWLRGPSIDAFDFSSEDAHVKGSTRGLVSFLLRPRYVSEGMSRCDYHQELLKYLDNRVVGFSFLKNRYISYHLKNLW